MRPDAPQSPLLCRFWFQRPTGFGYGVTAYSREDAESLLAEEGLEPDWVEVVEGVDVSSLDPGHVLSNVGLVPVRGIWYPALNVSGSPPTRSAPRETVMASRDDQAEARLLFRRRMMYVVLLVLAVGVGVWFVKWVGSGVGMDKIGEHYKQADKLDEP
jgi:hypothetical protein